MKAIALLQVIMTSLILIGVIVLTYVHVWSQTITWMNITVSSIFIVLALLMFLETKRDFNELKNK